MKTSQLFIPEKEEVGKYSTKTTQQLLYGPHEKPAQRGREKVDE